MPLSVEATIRQSGWHRWPEAPDHRAYLRFEHRHLFVVSAEVAVTDGQRAVEFHDLQDALRGIIENRQLVGINHAPTLDSCETMADLVASSLRDRHYTPLHVSVSEDGENTGHWRAG